MGCRGKLARVLSAEELACAATMEIVIELEGTLTSAKAMTRQLPR